MPGSLSTAYPAAPRGELDSGRCRSARSKLTLTCSVGYVEFVELETVQKALALSGTKLLGLPIVVQYTEAEKNRQARDGAPSAAGPPTG